MKLIFASNNIHKIEEIRSIIGNSFEIITLKESGIDSDIPEPYDTIAENASAKSRFIYQFTGKNCFSDDTGLEVDALGGEPGVKSARYAGENKSFDKNIEKLLLKLGNSSDRKARFRAVISLILDGKDFQFEGICEGKINFAPKGNSGFGYDPIFIPEGENRTFAEMSLDEKNRHSHRRKALVKLVAFLQKWKQNHKIESGKQP